jgi:hypothetical protein
VDSRTAAGLPHNRTLTPKLAPVPSRRRVADPYG